MTTNPTAPQDGGEKLARDLIRPIAGIENRTAQEVFEIMVDRIIRDRRRPFTSHSAPHRLKAARDGLPPDTVHTVGPGVFLMLQASGPADQIALRTSPAQRLNASRLTESEAVCSRYVHADRGTDIQSGWPGPAMVLPLFPA